MEQVTGTLNGRTGTFALQHTGTMNRGAPQLSVTVVPDSGTSQLVGLAGRMDTKITDGNTFTNLSILSWKSPDGCCRDALTIMSDKLKKRLIK